MPTNLVFVRADLVDYWRLMAEAGIRLARHYILYPNPGPRSATWPGAGTPTRCSRSSAARGRLECRSNWNIYVEELRRRRPADRPQVAVEAFEAPSPLTLSNASTGIPARPFTGVWWSLITWRKPVMTQAQSIPVRRRTRAA